MDYKIIIDASHGGDDTGCMLSNIPEKNITLELSKYMYQKFEALNVPVMLVRDKDETIFPVERIKKITEMYGDHKFVIVISNHVYSDKSYEIVYGLQQSSQLPNRIASNLMQHHEQVICRSKRLGSNAHLDYYSIHRDIANMQVLRISYPFVQNRGDLDKGVDTIVDTIYEYIGGKVENDWYQVSKGDTMWNVAKKFHLSVDELKVLNGFTDNLLRTGDKIKTKKEENVIQYVVGKGENLYQICHKFDIDLIELMEYNHKKSNLIQMGDVIQIPKRNSIEHSVCKGENLYQIAGRYQTDVKELVTKNHLQNKQVQTGDIITI